MKVVTEMQLKFREQAHPDIAFVHVHNPTGGFVAENGYYALSRHFKWALNKVKDIYFKKLLDWILN